MDIQPDRGHLSPVTGAALARLRERKRFIRFTRNEERLLAGLRPAFRAGADAIVQAFYEHLLAFEPLRPLLADPVRVQQVKQAQKRYLMSLTAGRYGREYLEDRLRIGRTHERIGLLPQWYLGTYSFYLDLLEPVVREHFGGDGNRTIRACQALEKLMNLDAQIVLEIYFETRQQKAVARSERLAAVGELAASIAHEVRNPLAGIQGALEVLRKGMAADPSRREVMDEVMAQVVRLETLVRDLLTFAQPRPLSRQTVNLNDLVDRVVRFLQESLDRSGIRVRRDSQTPLPGISADPQQLEQVFLNLIENAVQAMEAGGTLSVDTRESGDSLQVAFTDTGKGIPAGDLQRIFHPFFTTKHRGSGLGLSIVQKIVEAHDGSVRVESEPGRGTRVTVLLPRREPTHAA